MPPRENEEVWFARVVMILGASKLIDAIVNLVTIVKLQSGLAIAGPGAARDTAIALFCSDLIAATYILGGGSLFSRWAYGRSLPRYGIGAPVGLPVGAGFLAIAFNAFGVHQLISALGSAALGIAYYQRAATSALASAPRAHVIETGWVLERLLIGLVLLSSGGKIARYFVADAPPIAADRASDSAS
jgi:hypothetical protein